MAVAAVAVDEAAMDFLLNQAGDKKKIGRPQPVAFSLCRLLHQPPSLRTSKPLERRDEYRPRSLFRGAPHRVLRHIPAGVPSRLKVGRMAIDSRVWMNIHRCRTMVLYRTFVEVEGVVNSTYTLGRAVEQRAPLNGGKDGRR